MKKIVLSSAKTTPVTAEFKGGEFTFEIKNFTVEEQEEYDNIIDECSESKTTIGNFHRKRWGYAIINCSLDNPLEVLPYFDVKKILTLVDSVNNDIDEKKS